MKTALLPKSLLRQFTITTSVLTLLLLAGSSALAAVQYTITDLGALGGRMSWAYGINDSGQVVGTATTAGDGAYHAFLYDGGVMTDLGTPYPNISVEALGINNSGQIVGDYGGGSAFLYSSGVMTDLGTLGGSHSYSTAVNDSGQIVGYADTADGQDHPFLHSGGSMTDLGAIGNLATRAWGINSGGQISINTYKENATTVGQGRAYLYSGGVITNLGTLGGGNSQAYGMNDSGQVVGMSSTTGEAAMHAFLYSEGTMTDLGTLSTGDSNANDINNHGQIVGTFQVPSVRSAHAFLYSNGVMVDLNSLIPADSDWRWLVEATAINDRGQIIGWGLNSFFLPRAFLLTPLPPPNQAPVAKCKDVTVPAGANCAADASIDDGSYDPDGDAITLTQSPAGPYPLGTNSVALTVTDTKGASNSCSALVIVLDTTPPQITCPADVTVDSTSLRGAVVTFAPGAGDDCSGPPSVVSVPASGSTFPIGTTTVVSTATDKAGNSAGCSFQVTVLSPAQMLQRLQAQVDASVARHQPLDATLNAALASLKRGNLTAAVNQLHAFQNQVRAQVARSDSTLADSLLSAAQDIAKVLAAR